MIQNSASAFRRRRESAENSSRNTPRGSRSTRVRRKNRMTSRWMIETETMEVMDCVCENPIDVVTSWRKFFCSRNTRRTTVWRRRRGIGQI